MAKLSAHGRTEVYRVEQLKDELGPNPIRRVMCLMSDNFVLSKTSFLKRNAAGELRVDHTTNWQWLGRKKAEVTPEEWLQNRLKSGWRRAA